MEQPVGHALWSFQNAILFMIVFVAVLIGLLVGSRTVFDIKRIKDDWANQRCTPLIMPFAGLFGYDTKENFEFCMGKIFTTHSQNHMGSITSLFTKFTMMLQSIFQSVNGLRNTIASLGGGINVIFQEFTERISMFFFRLRMSSIHLKSLFMRMYALLFSVMYMGMSGVTGMTSFTNTFLFSFLDTFCFPGDTRLIRESATGREEVSIQEIQIGDRLFPGGHRVTALFQFLARGQAMVRLGRIRVSTNHYVMDKGKPVRAGAHPDAQPDGVWESDAPLYCLNTDSHHLPIDSYVFLDYDEAPEADKEAMVEIEKRVNGGVYDESLPLTEHGGAMRPDTKIKMASGEYRCAKEIRLGDQLSTGSMVAGVIRKRITEQGPSGMTPSTMRWEEKEMRWRRMGHLEKWEKGAETDYCGFVVVPNSQLEVEEGTFIRDYMEWCSPEAETVYSQVLENNKRE